MEAPAERAAAAEHPTSGPARPEPATIAGQPRIAGQVTDGQPTAAGQPTTAGQVTDGQAADGQATTGQPTTGRSAPISDPATVEAAAPSGSVPGRMRVDPHIHTLASDGVSDVESILEQAVAVGLDAIAITDHERIDAALAARSIAQARGLPLEVIVGEEITTRGGHLVGLFLTRRIRPWHSMRTSIALVHEQGGLAIVAHPLVPYPLCASARTIRRLMDEADPVFHPDALEGFNPTTARMSWSRRAPALAEQVGIAAIAGSDAHAAWNVGRAVTTFDGASIDDLRIAIERRDTGWAGEAYAWREQLRSFGHQQRKNAAAIRDEVRGKLRRDGTGRDLGYPGGRARPVRFDPAAAGIGAAVGGGMSVEQARREAMAPSSPPTDRGGTSREGDRRGRSDEGERR